MSTKEDRKAIHGYVSYAAHDAWHETGDQEGFSVSAVLQVLGDLGPDGLAALMTNNIISVNGEAVSLAVAARRIGAQRRRRKG